MLKDTNASKLLESYKKVLKLLARSIPAKDLYDLIIDVTPDKEQENSFTYQGIISAPKPKLNAQDSKTATGVSIGSF